MQDMMNNTESHTDNHISVDEYLPEFLSKYNADSIREINCDSVSEEDFETLGDAVMERNHPGEAHEQMDAMMGGEGSENLKQMHINMGRSYLDCNDREEGGVMNMGYMMGGGYGNWSGMPMMGGGFGALWLVNGILISILLVVLIRYFWKKGGERK